MAAFEQVLSGETQCKILGWYGDAVKTIGMIFCWIILCCGCATVPDNALGFDQVDIPKPGSDEAVVVFYRQYTPPVSNDMLVYVNDQHLVSLPNNSFSYVLIEPGVSKLLVGFKYFFGIDGFSGNTNYIKINAGEVLYIELNSVVYAANGIRNGIDEHYFREERIAVDKLRACCKYIENNIISMP